MKTLIITCLVALLAMVPVSAVEKATRLFNVRESGAVGDGATLDTAAIQSAIDACSGVGGGKVWVPAGRFVIGTLHLRSNVTLSLDHGAELLGSQNLKDYPIDKLRPSREGNSECLLYAEDATNIRLEGLGVIDGRGQPEFFPKRAGRGGKDNRPRLMENFFLQEIHSAGVKKRPDIPGLNEEIIAGNRSYRTRGVRTERYKYFKYYEHDPVIEELYDLKADPHEQTNLLSNPEYGEVLSKLRKKTEELHAQATE